MEFEKNPFAVTDKPTVSIIMNCLNAEPWLGQALESVRAQSFQNFEIIFWDNKSSDKSVEIASTYGPKLRLFQSSETVPLGKARNCAIAKARGDFIAFLDCDDLWKPTKLEKQLAQFKENPRLGLSCTDTEIFNSQKVLNRIFAGNPPARGMVFDELVKRQWISMSSAMIRHDAVTGMNPGKNANPWFDERLNICEEADLFYRIAYFWELDFIDEPLAAWRVHGKNTTFEKFGELASETLMILEKQQNLFENYNQEHPQTAALLKQRAVFQKAVGLWQKGDGKTARNILKEIHSTSLKHRLFGFATYMPSTLFNFLAKIYFSLPASLRHQGNS